MIDVYVRAQVLDLLGTSGSLVSKRLGTDVINTLGEHIDSFGDQFATLPFNSNEYKWTQAISDVIVAEASSRGYNVLHIYLQDYVSIKP